MYKIKTTIISVALLLVSTSTNAMAEGIDSLKKFYNSTQSISAKFHQVVTDTKGQKIQDVFGDCLLYTSSFVASSAAFSAAGKTLRAVRHTASWPATNSAIIACAFGTVSDS